MASNPLLTIKDYGQSIWMDNLTRDLIQSGELKRMIENQGIRGITTNPAIFEKAIASNALYETNIKAGFDAGLSVEKIYESLIFEDIRNACDLFRPIYEESEGLDGYVSIEVPPTIANDTKITIEEAQRYYREIGRENVMIKIPGTLSGAPAVEQVISQGISVNVTLLFSISSYEEAAWAYIRGLETRVKQGKDITKISSVASFFLSRIDTKVDQMIEDRMHTIGTEGLQMAARLTAVKGKVAIANAKIAYQKYKEIIQSERWQALSQKGANVQRLLWASTSTKDPAYSDVMYVNELIGADTVNTLPPATIEACADHCDVANRLETRIEEAYTLMDSLKEPDIDINIDQVMAEVLDEGIDKFVQPFESLMESIELLQNKLVAAK
ncbi:transaldolase [Calothrix sp. PCC 6303]|uniref:transaldolase n=1 Tax=Calothrix sp. PCC 6303 TaxID=1170562 RepID=UPI0002A032DB|nr:transaldolase [Calothrix sp. PCC 6303]AFZ02858.1 transaldolase [Calothrix sp. PCC 6303]